MEMRLALAEHAQGASSSGRFLLANSVSPRVQAIERMIEQVAPTNIPVLLVGESGTGKQIFAQRIHDLSSRRDKPFVKALCGSLTEDALSPQFQRERKNGHSELEGGVGTLFLKEISELDQLMQRQLSYSVPVGGWTPVEMLRAPRLISSTVADLEKQVKAGHFRADLYYHISALNIVVPALRDRKEDIPAFVDLFLTKYSTLLGRAMPMVRSQDLTIFQELPWPGNIRELENAVMKMVVLNDAGAVLSELAIKATELSLLSLAQKGDKHPPLKDAVRAASYRTERQLILQALAKTRWNRKRAAKELQISYKALLYKLKQIRAEDEHAV